MRSATVSATPSKIRYTYLMEKYEDNDTIFIFGFSRGAYVARALAAMVHMYGLMQRGNEPLIRYVLKMFKKKKKTNADFDLAAQFKATFSRQCKMHFVGVWDTVSSIGWLYDPLSLPFTRTNPDIEIGRQAISIDERRAAFRQNLWAVDPKYPQDIQQIWFAGVHSDVGGGYAEPQSGLAKITLQWMLEQAEAQGLSVDHALRDQVLGLTDPNMAKAGLPGRHAQLPDGLVVDPGDISPKALRYAANAPCMEMGIAACLSPLHRARFDNPSYSRAADGCRPQVPTSKLALTIRGLRKNALAPSNFRRPQPLPFRTIDHHESNCDGHRSVCRPSRSRPNPGS